jgi:NitT/TauT family transport system ATP-binding protein
MEPQSGFIKINGISVDGPGLDRGVVFQDYSLFPWMSAGENVALAINQAYRGKKRKDAKQLAEQFLDLVGLPNAFSKLPGELSGGMRQRVAIARSLAIGSPVLLLDEPFGALDPITRARLQDLLLQLWQQKSRENKTIIFITHDVEEALILADKVAVLGLDPGTVKEVIPVEIPRPRRRSEIYRDPRYQALRSQLIDLMNENIIAHLDADQISLPDGGHI